MRINLRIKRKEENWFAWYPVKMSDDTFCWLEKVKRTPIYANGFFRYYSYDFIK